MYLLHLISIKHPHLLVWTQFMRTKWGTTNMKRMYYLANVGNDYILFSKLCLTRIWCSIRSKPFIIQAGKKQWHFFRRKVLTCKEFFGNCSDYMCAHKEAQGWGGTSMLYQTSIRSKVVTSWSVLKMHKLAFGIWQRHTSVGSACNIKPSVLVSESSWTDDASHMTFTQKTRVCSFPKTLPHALLPLNLTGAI